MYPPAYKFNFSIDGFPKATDMTISDRDFKSRIKIHDLCVFAYVCKRLPFCVGYIINLGYWKTIFIFKI